MTHIYSPLRYPGGKNCIFPFISNIFRENGLVGSSYAEPYAGGAGLALRLLFEEYAENIFINDLDPLIYAFWSSVIERTDDFCSWIDKTPISIDTWRRCKDITKNPSSYDSFQIGTATFFLNRTNVSGIINGGIIGGLDQKGEYKIDARYNCAGLISRINKIGRFRDRITLSKLDGIKFIQNLNRRKSDVFIYLDPPYYEKGSKLYMNAYNDSDHTSLSQYLPNLKKPWITSYDNSRFIIDLYEAYRKIAYRVPHSTSNKIGNEILIFSDCLNLTNSVDNLKEAVVLH